jgi:hypothetical protein
MFTLRLRALRLIAHPARFCSPTWANFVQLRHPARREE